MVSISQNLKLNGSVIVTTPQDIALLDARRAVEMFNKVNVKTIGLVQNMSFFCCSKCGNKEYIFGRDGAAKLAKEIGCTIKQLFDIFKYSIYNNSNNFNIVKK